MAREAKKSRCLVNGQGEGVIRVRRTYAVSLIAAIIAAAAIASAYASAWTPNRQTLNERRHHVMDIREKSCLNTWRPKPISEVANLRFAWGWWGALKERTRAKGDRCGLAWYYTDSNGDGRADGQCVHEHEGAWNANTGNGYYGGFQADLSFQATYNPAAYARYGTANNWTPLEQIRMAWNGWKARGWYPWPNTARACGLL